MNISTHKTQSTLIRVWRAHTHIRNSQPYQLHASTHALTGQAKLGSRQTEMLLTADKTGLHLPAYECDGTIERDIFSYSPF